ncbi:hypothetical protein RW26_17605 [Aeromonas sp. L_1B5_3]|nr:hypothetical protein RW26_17605 [Aeromonas sp. L_1B5_3]
MSMRLLIIAQYHMQLCVAMELQHSTWHAWLQMLTILLWSGSLLSALLHQLTVLVIVVLRLIL